MKTSKRASAYYFRTDSCISVKTRALVSTSTIALLTATALLAATNSANAQQSPKQVAATEVEEITVTGTRVIRDGYQAPTPLTVLGIEEIEKSAPANIADFVNTFPQLQGSRQPEHNINSSGGLAGVNALNLRNLGVERTLVLVDGQRTVGNTVTGTVDINNIPQQLVSRVDIVTGGASAAYGSDALAGVVNFVLDKTFTGIKGEVSGGMSTYGDAANWKAVLSAGTGFASERGHFIISGEVGHQDAVEDPSNRAWNREGWGIMRNPNYTPTNGQPERLTLNPVNNAQATPGGLITAGPLKGIAFGPGGVPYNFDYGVLNDGANMYGSSQAPSLNIHATQWLGVNMSRQNIFTRASYDITENINAFAQFSWGHSATFSNFATFYNANLTTFPDNPFIPESVAQRVRALGLTSLRMGSTLGDTTFGTPYLVGDRRTDRYVVGLDGDLDAFNTEWTWDVYYQHGISRGTSKILENIHNANFARAIDAVMGPNGQIICRSTLTSPADGCVPYNLFGERVNSQAAIDYIEGRAFPPTQRNERFTQKVIAASISGEPFSTWAGPVSVAFGAEHRTESSFGVTDPVSQATGWRVGNYLATIGEFSVTEGFAETVVPLANDEDWARSLDINAAIRATDYSTSGYVTTWKAGVTYSPVDDIRFRLTRSRDIRAPNLADLYAGGNSGPGAVLDPFNGNQNATTRTRGGGNPNLKPEIADTTGVGVVLQPSFVPGFNASVDYWNIDVKGAVGNVGAQNIINFCYQGIQSYCDAITREPLVIVIRTSPFNLAKLLVRGVDFESSYRIGMADFVDDWSGDLSFRLVFTRYLRNISDNTINPPVDLVGQNSGGTSGTAATPRWRWTAALAYENETFDTSLTARGVSSGTLDNSLIECESGCPASTTNNPTINSNFMAGAVYFDVAGAYKFTDYLQAFFNVQNVADKDPPPYPTGPAAFAYSNSLVASGLYSTYGRTFRAGIRFRM